MAIERSAKELLEMTLENTVEGLVVDGSTDIHAQLMHLMEPTIYRSAMYMNKYNQSKAAISLGVSRGTLRTKLKLYFGSEFI